MLGIDRSEVEKAIAKQFQNKKKAIELNLKAIDIGISHATENIEKRDPFRCQRMDKTTGKIIIDGNSACALGAMFAGVTVAAWYPITPSSSLSESLSSFMAKYRHDEDGKATYAIVQAEDELAAIGMSFGAGRAGARAMTSTSGPGISLMSEFIGFAYYAEIPVVIYDITRVGPSTGLPTRTQQSDIVSLAFLSHGDTRHIVLIPSDIQECFTMSMLAFDLAERIQTPIFVMSDLDLGMNSWMADKLEYPSHKLDRGKVLSKEDIEATGKFERYRDVDGDAIPYRTLPGTDHPLASYFTRGSGHDERAAYSERADDYKNNMDRLDRKYATARSLVPAPIIEYVDGAQIGLLAFGTTVLAASESRHQLATEYELRTNFFKLRAIPFNEELLEFIDKCDRVYVIEQNRDAQMASLMRIELSTDRIAKLRSVLHYTGIPIDARFITDDIVTNEKGEGN